MSTWEEIEELLAVYDGDLEITVASECCWSGQLRLTLTDPMDAPSRSITFYSVGGGSPEMVAARLLDDFKAWLEDSSDAPLPPPDWKTR